MTTRSANPGPGGWALEWEDRLLLPAIVLLPWAFGGVEIWAFRSAALLLVLGAAVALVRHGPAGWGLDRGARWLLPALLLGVWAAIQLIPLPSPMIRLLSPGAHRIYADSFPTGDADASTVGGLGPFEQRALRLVPEAAAHPLPTGAGESLEVEAPACLTRSWRTLSLEPSATGERLAWYVALLLGFLVVRRRVANPRIRGIYLGALLVTFAALAVFGLIQNQTWNGRIYWLRRPRGETLPFGPYVNPNHFAGVMELAVPVLAAFGWSRLRRSGRAAVYEGPFAGAAIAGAACVAAGLATASKLGAGLIVLGLVSVMVFGARSFRVRAWLAGAVLLLAAAVAGLMVETDLGSRVASYVARARGGDVLEARGALWLAGREMFLDFPLTGAGFGAFPEVFFRYTPPGALARFAQAHNDYVEVLLEGGMIGMALLAWLIVGFSVRAWRGLLALEPAERLVPLGVLIGVSALSTHAFFEFPHQMPGNALLFVTMCAFLVPADGRSAAPASGR